ncbi:hypothetical protein BK133_13335 [Paenibacillus sp. FSL H8-0548]|uniref:hypothetical protein n=1 Tax=Paenibacillus sp. FSL H8-0548 TaxID=1920422 RepID=UPI00096F31FA|nr:hypothetical protein [Paenibacillus sp. FSL H8-0548]OMF33769.1 hypothetical protein BK133_13335 [Paenibacillus sp. FSL H8-0548]
MSRVKKVCLLVLLITVCAFPASAFAASSNNHSSKESSFFSSFFSIFSGSKSDQSQSKQPKPIDTYKVVNYWESKNWFSWFDKKDNWYDDKHWGDDKSIDSYKIWEFYYCY